jgi:hypothetical protein
MFCEYIFAAMLQDVLVLESCFFLELTNWGKHTIWNLKTKLNFDWMLEVNIELELHILRSLLLKDIEGLCTYRQQVWRWFCGRHSCLNAACGIVVGWLCLCANTTKQCYGFILVLFFFRKVIWAQIMYTRETTKSHYWHCHATY